MAAAGEHEDTDATVADRLGPKNNNCFCTDAKRRDRESIVMKAKGQRATNALARCRIRL